MSVSETPQQVPSLRFDPSSRDLDVDPHPTFARIREEAPIHFWPEAHAYVVTRFADVAQVMRDQRLSTDPKAAGQPAIEDTLPDEIRGPAERGLFRLSTKDHARVRRAVSPALTPRAVERLRPELQRLVNDALAPFEGKREVDIATFADFVPLRAIALLLDIPPEYEPSFRAYANANVKSVDPRLSIEERGKIMLGSLPGMRMIRELIAARRENLGDDLLSTLIRAEAAGDRLSEDEMVSLVSALITGGSETTVHFICFAVKSLLCVPERAAAVRADPSVLKSALEEILRFDSFGKSGLVRYAVEDVEIGGVKIARGSRVVGILSAATRDPRAFVDADTYDPRREPVENLNFGSGMHFCLGAALARAEGEIAIQTLMDRYTDIELVGEPVYADNPILRKIDSMRVRVTPRVSASA